MNQQSYYPQHHVVAPSSTVAPVSPAQRTYFPAQKRTIFVVLEKARKCPQNNANNSKKSLTHNMPATPPQHRTSSKLAILKKQIRKESEDLLLLARTPSATLLPPPRSPLPPGTPSQRKKSTHELNLNSLNYEPKTPKQQSQYVQSLPPLPPPVTAAPTNAQQSQSYYSLPSANGFPSQSHLTSPSRQPMQQPTMYRTCSLPPPPPYSHDGPYKSSSNINNNNMLMPGQNTGHPIPEFKPYPSQSNSHSHQIPPNGYFAQNQPSNSSSHDFERHEMIQSQQRIMSQGLLQQQQQHQQHPPLLKPSYSSPPNLQQQLPQSQVHSHAQGYPSGQVDSNNYFVENRPQSNTQINYAQQLPNLQKRHSIASSDYTYSSVDSSTNIPYNSKSVVSPLMQYQEPPIAVTSQSMIPPQTTSAASNVIPIQAVNGQRKIQGQQQQYPQSAASAAAAEMHANWHNYSGNSSASGSAETQMTMRSAGGSDYPQQFNPSAQYPIEPVRLYSSNQQAYIGSSSSNNSLPASNPQDSHPVKLHPSQYQHLHHHHQQPPQQHIRSHPQQQQQPQAQHQLHLSSHQQNPNSMMRYSSSGDDPIVDMYFKNGRNAEFEDVNGINNTQLQQQHFPQNPEEKFSNNTGASFLDYSNRMSLNANYGGASDQQSIGCSNQLNNNNNNQELNNDPLFDSQQFNQYNENLKAGGDQDNDDGYLSYINQSQGDNNNQLASRFDSSSNYCNQNIY